MRKKIEKNFWDLEIIGNRRKKQILAIFHDARSYFLGSLIALKINQKNGLAFFKPEY